MLVCTTPRQDHTCGKAVSRYLMSPELSEQNALPTALFTVALCFAANPTKDMRLQWQQEAKEK